MQAYSGAGPASEQYDITGAERRGKRRADSQHHRPTLCDRPELWEVRLDFDEWVETAFEIDELVSVKA